MSRSPEENPASPAPAAAAAATWIWRLDRGLSPAEQDAFFQWLAADPAHAEALRRCRTQWSRLDQLADWRPEHSQRPNPDLLAPSSPRPWRRYLWPLALAAALVVAGLLNFQRPGTTTRPEEPALVRHEIRQILPDRTSARLNSGARLTVAYSPRERRVRLEAGEAFFTVTRDPARPFIVEAGGVDVRAVGTAFNVRLAGARLDVLVTAGTVALATAQGEAAPAADGPRPELALLQANQRVSLALGPHPAPRAVEAIDRHEILRHLAWQHGLMNFQDESLAAIVSELNRINPTQIVLQDDALAASRFSGTIRSDNVEGFARLLESAFGAEITRSAGGELHLRTKPSPP